MSKTIKVIDLLNKIANGEEVPEKIKFNEDIFEYYPSEKEYKSFVDEDRFCGQTLLFAVMYEHRINEILNCEVEIIEEQEEIDIQNIEEIKDIFIENSTCGEDVKYLARKYNEILKWAKQLDKKIKEK